MRRSVVTVHSLHWHGTKTAAKGFKIARIAIHLPESQSTDILAIVCCSQILMVPNICWVLFYVIKRLFLRFLWCSHVFELLEILLDNNDRVVFVTEPCSCLLQAGVLWHLLLFLFNYDFTLDESGVEKSAETNQQVRRQEKLNSCWKTCRHCATENGECFRECSRCSLLDNKLNFIFLNISSP